MCPVFPKPKHAAGLWLEYGGTASARIVAKDRGDLRAAVALKIGSEGTAQNKAAAIL
jgi:hypothetical protein